MSEILGHGLAVVRGEPVLVAAADLAALGTGTVVGEDQDHRVVHGPEPLQCREQAADLCIGVRQEAGEDLLLTGEQPALVGWEVAPALHPFGAGGEHGALGHDARGDLPREHLLTPCIPSLVEQAPVRVDPLGCDMVGGVHGAQCEVQEEGLARCAVLLVLDHADGLVGQVLAQVIALLGPARRLDVVVVADQVRGPLVGVALEEPVVALEPEAKGPIWRTARRPSAASAA